MILRRAVNFEYYMSLFHGDAPMHFATTALLEGKLTLNQIRNGCSMLQKRHPLLRSRVEYNEHGDPYIADHNVPEIPVFEIEVSKGSVDIERNENSDHWLSLLEKELLVYIDLEKGPFVRFFWLKEIDSSKSALILICDHISFDGGSAAVILEDLLEYIQNPNQKVESYTILPGITDLLKDDIAEKCEKHFLEHDKPGFEKQCKEYNDKIAKEGKPEKKADSKKKKQELNLIAWKLDKEQSQQVVKACKSNEVTVHTALALAFLKAFYIIEGPEDRTKRVLQFPVSGKSFFKESIEGKLGCNMDLAIVPVTLDKDKTFWEEAGILKDLIKDKLENGNLFADYYWGKHYLSKIDGVKQFFESLPPWDEEEEASQWEFSLSNIGVQKLKVNYGDFKLRGFFGPTFSGLYEKVIGVNSTNGEMYFTLICGSELMSYETLNRIRKLTTDILMESC